MAIRHSVYSGSSESSSSSFKLGTHKGARRLWLEGKRLVDIGFDQGVRYQAETVDGALHLRLTPAGNHVVSGTPVRPVVDILSRALPQVERIMVRFLDGEVRVSIHPTDAAALGRLERVNTRLAGGFALRLGSICHGGGVTADALLRGLRSAGTPAQLAFAIEKEAKYLEQSLEHNLVWADGGHAIQASIDEVDTSTLPFVEVLSAGLPCVSASRAGRAKKGLQFAEQEAKTAHLSTALCMIVKAIQPALVVLENVPEYTDTASAHQIRAWLESQGYTIHEVIIHGSDFSLEARNRMVLIAVTRGLTIDLAQLQGVAHQATLAEVLEPVALDDASWIDKEDSQADKRARDEAKGNGFQPQRVTPQSTRIGTIRRLYQNGGQTDTRLVHPKNRRLSRLLTPVEHARIKGVPLHLIDGLCKTTAHEVLGQSVTATAFVALGSLLAKQVAPFTTKGSNS